MFIAVPGPWWAPKAVPRTIDTYLPSWLLGYGADRKRYRGYYRAVAHLLPVNYKLLITFVLGIFYHIVHSCQQQTTVTNCGHKDLIPICIFY